jgi:hypothetical protein
MFMAAGVCISIEGLALISYFSSHLASGFYHPRLGHAWSELVWY